MPRSRRAPFVALSVAPDAGTTTLRALVYRSCLDAIVDGRLRAGERLPSARQLARDWRVSRNTVDDALASLQAEGLLVRRVGSGTFVADVVSASATRARPLRPPSSVAREALAHVSRWSRTATRSHAVNASPKPHAFMAAMPDLELFPFELWRRLTARRLRTSARLLAGYLPSLGLPALQSALARHLAGFRGIGCEPGQILVLNSTMQAADLVVRVLVDRGQRVWIEDPSFPNLRSALAVSGARLVAVPVDEQGLDVEQGVSRAGDAALAYVTPACQYPLGVALSSARRRALVEWSGRTGAWIVEDDFQGEFAYARRPVAPLAALDRSGRVIHVGSFTTSTFPSLRLAYVVLPPSLVDVFAAVRGQLDDHTHGFAQAVLADFIDGGHYAAHVRRMRSVYAERCEALADACSRELGERARLVATQAGISAALALPRSVDDRDVAATVAGHGVSTMPLSRYALRSRRWRGLVLGFAALDERAIRAGVRALARGIDAAVPRRARR